MSATLRFSASGGSLFENVCGRMVERDPFEIRRNAEQWSREGLEHQKRGNHRLARLLAADALGAELALSVWREQRRAACGVDPFKHAYPVFTHDH